MITLICVGRNALQLQGLRFSKLTVIGRSPSLTRNDSLWECKCDCGNTTIARWNQLVRKIKKSCGCVAKKWRSSFGSLNQLPKGESGFHVLVLRYKHGARTRKIAWELTDELCRTLTSSPCWYCGSLPAKRCVSRSPMSEQGVKHGTYTYNGIDRVDNALGYIESNVVTCCTACNSAKNTGSLDDFIQWGIQLGENLKKRYVKKAFIGFSSIDHADGGGCG